MQGKILKLLLPKYLKHQLLGEEYLNYASSLPRLLNYQMAPSFRIPPTGISKIVGHPLRHNFDFPISLGKGQDNMLKLINILPRQIRAYLRLDMEKTQSHAEKISCMSHRRFCHIFHEQIFLYAITSAFRIQVDTYGTFQNFY